MEASGKHRTGQELKLLRSFSRIELQKFGSGLVVGCLLITMTYFSTSKFDSTRLSLIQGQQNATLERKKTGVITQNADQGQQNATLESEKAVENVNSSSIMSESTSVSEDSAEHTKQFDQGQKNATLDSKKVDVVVDNTNSSFIMSESTSITGDSAENPLQFDQGLQNLTSKNAESSSSVAESSHVSKESAKNAEQFEGRQEKIKSQKKPMCDLSNRRIDLCDLDGDVRILGRKSTVIFVPSPENNDMNTNETWRIKPYPRKADPNAMANVKEVTLKSLGSSDEAPQCTDNHDVPAAVFSVCGYTGNYFHDFTDVLLPLFLTARRYDGEIQFVVVDFKIWWIAKYLPIFKSLSNYEIIDLQNDDRIHCYRHVFVGLTSHDDFSIDPSRSPNGYSMVDFTRFMRSTYSLERDSVKKIMTKRPKKKPRLLIIARERTRKFANLHEIIGMAERVGFETVVSEGHIDIAQFAKIVNSCDVMMGVHGAGLTNMVFMPTNAVVIQVVPWGGLEWVAGTYFRGPAGDMGLRYMEYSISEEESTLVEQYPRDHAVFKDPASIRARGWNSLKEFFLDKQDVRLDVRRFRPVLKKAMKLLHT